MNKIQLSCILSAETTDAISDYFKSPMLRMDEFKLIERLKNVWLNEERDVLWEQDNPSKPSVTS